MRSITVMEAIEEYRTYNRAQNYSPASVTASYRNLEEFAYWLVEQGRSDRIADLGIEDACALTVGVQERENRTRPGTRRPRFPTPSGVPAVSRAAPHRSLRRQIHPGKGDVAVRRCLPRPAGAGSRPGTGTARCPS